MAGLDPDVGLESEEQFWHGLGTILSSPCDTHQQIDDSLRGWLHLASAFREQFHESDSDVLHCAQQLLHRPIFADNKEYVRTQIVFSFLQEDDVAPLHIIASFLLADGRCDDTVFGRMISEGCFPRLLELLNSARHHEYRLHGVLLELMYEMCRMERLRSTDLCQVDDGFVSHLLQLVEEGLGDTNDPYQYPVIRVLLVLNEQYMLASAVDPQSPTPPPTNRVIKMLSLHGASFRTFGENIILLLNRETETSQQLLILKVLYLLFTTTATYEYFYTNDLKVLLDIIVRNLMDLPEEKVSLRHTYLRVLYPLLAHTQLRHPPHYKRDEVCRALAILVGGGAHFAPTDETTLRLVDRVSNVDWLREEEEGQGQGQGQRQRHESSSSLSSSSHTTGSPEARTRPKFLGISLTASQAASSVSVVDVAAVMEKPGVKTPSRTVESGGYAGDERAVGAGGGGNAPPSAPPTIEVRKAVPEVPRHRHGVPCTQRAALHMGQKKTPPKAPPPRRRGRRPVAAAANHAATAATTTPNGPEVLGP